MKMNWPLQAVVLLASVWLCLSSPLDTSPMLPPSLTPETYELSLDPDLYRGVFHGVVVISGVAVAATTRVSFHCSKLVINTTRVTDLTEGEEVEVVGLREDEVLQQCHLRLSKALREDHEYQVTVEFMGVIAKGGYGLYSDVYMEGGVRHDILMTHLQPNFARTMFPCWDEPHYKAQFLVKVTRGNFTTILSNMPPSSASSDSGWVEFEETLPMSPYLLVIVWCDYVALRDSTSNNSVWAPRDRLHEAQLALNISNVVLQLCARYFGREYPLPKLDHIPCPSLSNGAMENWGAITYKQEYLLWEEGVSTTEQMEMTAYVVSHELIHQWLGNLVTTAWWNTTWLNEGVTTFFHFYFVDKIMPTWNGMDTTFVIQIQMILNEEAVKDPRPLTNNEPMAQDIIATSAFSATTYMKGAAIIRMVYNLMPPDIFREAIMQYVMDNQYGSVDEGDLWQSVAAVADLPVDLESVMYSWTHQPGFPLVTVLRSPEGCISVRQEKYLGEDETDVRWTIPLTFTTSKTSDFDSPKTVWFPDDRSHLDLKECLDFEDWIVVNIRLSGFYRVNYDVFTWKFLTLELLKGNLSSIHPVNRAQLLSDGFDLARHGLLDYKIILDLTRYLKRETETLPWVVAIQNLMTLRLHFYNTEIFPKFQRYALNLVEGVFSRISLTEDLGDRLPEVYKRQIVVQFACTMGHRRCIRETTTTTYLLMSGVNVKVPLGLKATILCTAVRHGQSEVWHYVLKEYLSASDKERRRYLEALACTTNNETIARLLRDVVDASFLHKEDRVHMLEELSKQDDTLDPTLDMILDRFYQLTASIEFEVILDVLRSFLKPGITEKQKHKIMEIAEIVDRRQAPKELDMMATILEELHTEEYEGLYDDHLKNWFTYEVKNVEKQLQLSTVAPLPHKEVKVENPLSKGGKENNKDPHLKKTIPTTTVQSPLAGTASSISLAPTNLILLLTINVLCSLLRFL